MHLLFLGLGGRRGGCVQSSPGRQTHHSLCAGSLHPTPTQPNVLLHSRRGGGGGVRVRSQSGAEMHCITPSKHKHMAKFLNLWESTYICNSMACLLSQEYRSYDYYLCEYQQKLVVYTMNEIKTMGSLILEMGE